MTTKAPTTRHAGGRKKKSDATLIPVAQRRADLVKAIQDLGLWNLDRKDFATKHGVSVTQIHYDIEAIMPTIDIIDAQTTKFECGRVLCRVTRKAMVEMQNPKLHPLAQARWAEVALKSVQQHSDFLATFGEKPLVAEGADRLGEMFEAWQLAKSGEPLTITVTEVKE